MRKVVYVNKTVETQKQFWCNSLMSDIFKSNSN